MADKDFVVKNGFAVNGSILVVNTSTTSVGINTNNPDATLKVVGSANVSGLVTLGANLSVVGTIIGTLQGTANNASNLGGTAAASFALNSSVTANATTAYTNAASYADTKAATAYSNGVSYSGTIAATAYSNAVSYAGTIAGTAYSNAVSYAASIAGTAYANAVAISTNATTISSGTLNNSRLPQTISITTQLSVGNTTIQPTRIDVNGLGMLQHDGSAMFIRPSTGGLYLGQGSNNWIGLDSGGTFVHRNYTTNTYGYNALFAGSSNTTSGYFATYANTGARLSYIGYYDGSALTAIMTDGATPVILGSNSTTRVWISANGNIGVGNTAPVSKFVVYGAASGISDPGIAELTDTSRNGISFGYDSGNAWSWMYSRSPGTSGRQMLVNGTMYVGSHAGGSYAGKVGIGNSTPAYALDVNGDAIAGYFRSRGSAGWYSETYGGGWYMSDTTYMRVLGDKWIYTGGNIEVGGYITAVGDITSSSDARLKEDIEIIPHALEKVQKLNGVTFTRKGKTHKSVGVLAQDVFEVLPEAIGKTPDGHMTVAYGNMVGLLVEAIKELRAEVDKLKNGN